MSAFVILVIGAEYYRTPVESSPKNTSLVDLSLSVFYLADISFEYWRESNSNPIHLLGSDSGLNCMGASMNNSTSKSTSFELISPRLCLSIYLNPRQWEIIIRKVTGFRILNMVEINQVRSRISFLVSFKITYKLWRIFITQLR